MWGVEEMRIEGLQGTFKENEGTAFIRRRTSHTSHIPDDREQRPVKIVGKRVAGERRKKKERNSMFAPLLPNSGRAEIFLARQALAQAWPL